MYLVYINPLNKNFKGENIYEFLFTDKVDITYPDNWSDTPASERIITPITADQLREVITFKTDIIELDLAIYSETFSMADCVENVIALGWELYPPSTGERLVFHFGEEIQKIIDKLYSRDIFIKNCEHEKI